MKHAYTYNFSDTLFLITGIFNAYFDVVMIMKVYTQ